MIDQSSYGYVYDLAGNLIKKGNRYSIRNNTVTFTATEGEGVEYYAYEYNLQNRLARVKKNGEIVAEFRYDAEGMRIKAQEKLEEKQSTRTTYYIYGYSGKVLLEESRESVSPELSYASYIYAFGKTFAKIDGIIGVSTEITYFHYDNLGSTKLMTEQDGKIVMEQDYLPFGGDLPKVGQVEVYNEIGMEYKYTGQNEVVSIGLYYYGARYYDPAIGRFITEDTYRGEMNNPQSQHLYVYVINNPLVYTDPTGNVRAYFADSTISYPEEETESNEQVINPRSNNNTHIERPNTSYNPITKSLKSFGEIAKGFWSAADERRKRAFDSPYDFANYMTMGILDLGRKSFGQ
ncbi:MAG: RHS repeat-associated core domain-containing protein [Halanaerobiales bacterium]|nr:RHS repeat-associated core domain-containing protein [Halanaerobiales bacterium]